MDSEEILLYFAFKGVPTNIDAFVELFVKHKRIFSILLLSLMLIDILSGVHQMLMKEHLFMRVIFVRSSLSDQA